MIRVLLADDQALIRSGIRSLLEAEDDIEVVAEAADGQQAVALTAEHRPDIALVDIQMPAIDGIEATRRIVADERLDSVRVVILTNFGLDEDIFRALRAGASGFLLKATAPAELLQALRVVMRGDALLSPSVTRRLIGEFVARPPDAVAAAGMEALPKREREVVALVAHGLSNDEIAAAMVLSPTTAKTHVSRAMIKLGARDRAQLVVFAYQTGLVSPRDPAPRSLAGLAAKLADHHSSQGAYLASCAFVDAAQASAEQARPIFLSLVTTSGMFLSLVTTFLSDMPDLSLPK